MTGYTVCLCPCVSEALQKEKADREEQWLQELDDEAYDALPEEEKERIIQIHKKKLRLRKHRYWLEVLQVVFTKLFGL